MTDEQQQWLDSLTDADKDQLLIDAYQTSANTASLSDDRIDWLANAYCPNGVAYPNQVKQAIREALREASITDTVNLEDIKQEFYKQGFNAGREIGRNEASIADAAGASEPCGITPEEYAEYYYGARLHGLAPYTFAEYKKRAIAKESGK